MLEQRIQQQFFDSADLKLQSAEVLARPIADATSALLTALTSGGKVLLAGAGAGSALATHMARLLAGSFERERPPLAALALGADPVQQVKALGLPGDVLVYIDDGEGHSSGVITAAQDKDMTIVVLAGRGSQAFGELLAETDVLVAVPHERAARVAEVQLLVLHCLCDAVDFQLMGEQDP
ncbi:MAG: SIS domain-containing protein [Pseudomonadota bacterium]|nr:SIS domain-containing protein [Pseudomonadota bacterium]